MLLVGCSSRDEPQPGIVFERPSVLLVTLDTVRADRLGCYGYDRDTTPNLDALARESVRFVRAFAQSSFTPTSHASLLSSRYVTSHGLRWWNYRLPTEVVTVAEAFGELGYRTASFSPLAMGTTNALDQGFERVVEMRNEGEFRTRIDDDPANDYPIAPARAVLDRVTAWLDQEDDRPFFGWVHVYDAHRPFGVFAAEWKFGPDRRTRFGNSQGDYRLSAAARAQSSLGAAHAQLLEDRYDSGLAELDREVGRLVDHLRATGRLDDVILVVTADHGEAFDEFDAEWFSHDPYLFDAVTRVPLLVRFPDGRFGGSVVEPIAELVDVVPTILDYAGVPVASGMQGLSLRPAIEHGREVKPFAFSERQGQDRDDRNPDRKFTPDQIGRRRSLRFPNARLVVETAEDRAAFYDRDAEPAERTDRWSPDSVQAVAARRAYDEAVERIAALEPTMDPMALTDEQKEILRQLGYLR